jgi:multidrug resistance efflux pump
VPTTFVLVSTSSTELTAPHDGVIGEVLAASGTLVTKGTPIAKFDVSTAEKQVTELTAQLEQLKTKKERAGQEQAPPSPAVVDAQRALALAKANLDKALKSKKKTAIAAAKKKVGAAEQALARATAQAPAPVDVALIDGQMSSAQMTLDSFQAQIDQPNVIAPTSGLLTIELKKGSTVKGGSKLGVVESVLKLKAQIRVPAGERMVKGQIVEIEFENHQKKKLVVDADAQEDIAEAEFENTKGLKPGERGSAIVRGSPRSLLAR